MSGGHVLWLPLPLEMKPRIMCSLAGLQAALPPKVPMGLRVPRCRGWDLDTQGQASGDGPTATPLTSCLSFPESNNPCTAFYRCCTATDLSKCCVSARLP